ncbi:MAG: adenosylcobinamide amidohydrolase, partial [Kangiellaceae bacterium]|nr:adenosylcobinamide amidohydrolase [Kangiellaceae bacterium]
MKDVFRINPSAKVIRTNQYVSCIFDKPYRVLSSAVLNGGYQRANQTLNLKVDAHNTYNESPQASLQNF